MTTEEMINTSDGMKWHRQRSKEQNKKLQQVWCGRACIYIKSWLSRKLAVVQSLLGAVCVLFFDGIRKMKIEYHRLEKMTHNTEH